MNSFILYRRETESCNHIILWCSLAYELRTMAYKLRGINWAMARSVRGRDLGPIPLAIIWGAKREEHENF